MARLLIWGFFMCLFRKKKVTRYPKITQDQDYLIIEQEGKTYRVKGKNVYVEQGKVIMVDLKPLEDLI